MIILNPTDPTMIRAHSSLSADWIARIAISAALRFRVGSAMRLRKSMPAALEVRQGHVEIPVRQRLFGGHRVDGEPGALSCAPCPLTGGASAPPLVDRGGLRRGLGRETELREPVLHVEVDPVARDNPVLDRRDVALAKAHTPACRGNGLAVRPRH